MSSSIHNTHYFYSTTAVHGTWEVLNSPNPAPLKTKGPCLKEFTGWGPSPANCFTEANPGLCQWGAPGEGDGVLHRSSQSSLQDWDLRSLSYKQTHVDTRTHSHIESQTAMDLHEGIKASVRSVCRTRWRVKVAKRAINVGKKAWEGEEWGKEKVTSLALIVHNFSFFQFLGIWLLYLVND